MSNSSKQRLPSDGDAGQPQNNRQTRINPTIPRFSGGVNPQAIPTAAGGPVHWAVCDTLFTLKAELEALGLDCPHDVIAAAWFKVLTEASYIPEQERVAVLREAKTSWPA